jgi:nucleoside 2-deoxyribosyltransferase
MAQYKLIYIAGPYSSDDSKQKRANIEAAINAAIWCARNKIYYFCPHINSAYFDDLAPDIPTEFFCEMDLHIARFCSALVMLPNWEQSKGATKEYHYFTRANKPVFYYLNEKELLLKYYH